MAMGLFMLGRAAAVSLAAPRLWILIAQQVIHTKVYDRVLMAAPVCHMLV